MSAGSGFRYLLSSVAVGDGRNDPGTPLTRYYQQTGSPPGRWLGSGLALLGNGQLRPGDLVDEQQLRNLLGDGRDPVTGSALGRTFTDQTRRAPVGQGAGLRRVVAGWDLTFSPPKSVSTLWALADAGTQALIAAAHHAAIDDVLALVEDQVAMTRVGHGGVAQVEVEGVAATAFDHHDSRSGDPQLHTHVVISSKVRARHDGAWRALDGRPLFAAVVGLSEHYNAVLADRLTVALNMAWQVRRRGPDRSPAWEIAAVPQDLLQEFSSRAQDIDAEVARLIRAWLADHGHQPSRRTVLRLRQQATLATRPDKTVRTLADLTARWRERAIAYVGQDPTAWAVRLIATSLGEPLLRADDLSGEHVDALARAVLAQVSDKRATWRRWNLHAEAVRQTMHLRFASPEDRLAATEAITARAQDLSLRLTPPELAPSPSGFRRPDGSSIFRPRDHVVFSSLDVLAAEDRLLTLAGDTTGPVISTAAVARAGRRHQPGRHRASEEQTTVVGAIATSGRVLDLLVGPAGTGKTTALSVLLRAWAAQHGPGSVVGLAPSAAAAGVLADELEIACDTTAKWLLDQSEGRRPLQAGQLLIVDEASLAGTFALDAIAAHARAAGGKVLLVGDWAQLSGVETSGAFSLLVHARGDAPELSEVHRFARPWEKGASLRLRWGDPDVVGVYNRHHRVRSGDLDAVLDAAYAAWRADTDAGLASLLVADSNEIVAQLNQRAHTDLVDAGRVDPIGVRLHDGTVAGAGDLVVTRHNDRRLALGRSWVKNGDRWRVVHAGDDGTLTVRRERERWRGALILPAWYVADNVELGYATTAHRSQGSTSDTAHAIVASGTLTRELLYVAMTRGRRANTAWVATDQPQLEEHQRLPEQDVTAASVLTAVLQRVGAATSAHQMITTEQETWSSIRQLAAEYDELAASAQHEHWAHLLATSGLSQEQVADTLASDAFGALAAQLRRAHAEGHDLDTLLPRLVDQRELGSAIDVASVLHHRLTLATARPPTGRRRPERLIVGLIPAAAPIADPQMRAALSERARLITARARALAEAAVAQRQPWAATAGPAPLTSDRRQAWLRHLMTVAAYRDRHHITGPRPLGEPGERDLVVQLDRFRAQRALEEAARLAAAPAPPAASTRPAPARRERGPGR